MAKRQLSEAAKCAKLCKQYVKGLGLKCRATSETFSMGNSVSVVVYDLDPDTFRKIESELSQYQYGHFDGMQDMYVMSNTNKDIPQTKYLRIHNKISDELKQAAWTFLKNRYSNGEDKPECYEEAKSLKWCDNAPHYIDVSYEVNQLIANTGQFHQKEDSKLFWSEYKGDIEQSEERECVTEGVTVREGSKPGYVEIVFSRKPDADTRQVLKTHSFRWSRYNKCWWGMAENLPACFQ